MWEFKEYDVYEETDALRFENKEGDILGHVMYNGDKEQLINDLENGADPIADGWEDGIGNTITIDGWN